MAHKLRALEFGPIGQIRDRHTAPVVDDGEHRVVVADVVVPDLNESKAAVVANGGQRVVDEFGDGYDHRVDAPGGVVLVHSRLSDGVVMGLYVHLVVDGTRLMAGGGGRQSMVT